MIKFLAILCLGVACSIADPLSNEPVQLLSLASGNETGIIYDAKVVEKLFLDPKLADRQAVVISIVGAFRKGKSFLMNYILRYMYAHYTTIENSQLINADDWLGDADEPLSGFDWRSGTKRVTTGLILWSDVFLYDDPKGEKFAIYIMDTQGLFDHKSSPTDNSRIFSLSTLISSVQILNLFNIIQENQLQYLQFATEFARYAASGNSKSPFQNLLILIRDWNNPEEYKYGIRGGNAYLHHFLEITDNQNAELQSVRRFIRSSFENLEAFLMPYPGKTVARDAKYDGRWSEIDDDFVKNMQDLFEHLLSPKKLKAKQINGKSVAPNELLVFINEYVKNFERDGMPEADTLYESTLNKQFQILMAKSVDEYIEAVRNSDAELANENDINKVHAEAKAKALSYFNAEKKFGTYSEGDDFKKQLTKKIEESFQQWKGVTLTHLQRLIQQRSLTEAQETKVDQARNVDSKAKADLEQAIRNAEEAKKALEKARYDTEEARREAAELRKQSESADLQRHEAIEKEKQTREWLNNMKEKADYFEQQYNEYKNNAINQVGQQFTETQNESGFGGILKQIGNFFMTAVPFISTIGSWFG